MNKQEALKKIEELRQYVDELDNRQWTPQHGDMYFFVRDFGNEDWTARDNNCNEDRRRIEAGNCFRTKEEAEASNLYKLMNSDYHYWFPGFSEKPKEKPEGCEMFSGVDDEWKTCYIDPRRWVGTRRWPKFK